MQRPYIPAPIALYAIWLAGIATKITAAPADYGLEAGDATIIQGVADDFAAKYLISSDPESRTPASIAAMSCSVAGCR